MKPEIGNFGIGWFSPISETNDPRLTWDVVTDPNSQRPGVTTIWQSQAFSWGGELAGQLPQTDFAWVKKRFDLATNNKDKPWTYGSVLLTEETFHPAARCWSSKTSVSSWLIDGGVPSGTANFAGVTLTSLKTWYIQKYGSWDQSWFDKIKSNNNWMDPKIQEWSVNYGYNLHKAWHQHMRNLGKKSIVLGLIGIPYPGPSGMRLFESFGYKYPMWKYVIENYDMICVYQYPTCISCEYTTTQRPISASVDVVKQLREKYNYKGKIVQILTSLWPDNVGTGDIIVQQAEFNAVAPYVDVIMGIIYVYNLSGTTASIPYAPRLIKFWNEYPEPECPEPLCNFTVSQLS